MHEDLLLRLMLSDASFLTTKEKTLLQVTLDDAASLASLILTDIATIIHRNIPKAVWKGSESLKKAEISEKILSALSISWTAWDKADYPAMLTEMTDPPYMIFYRGNLSCLKNPCVSVVGTRRVTAGARKATETFARDAADDGVTVVSGLAYGVDSYAHRGSLLSSQGNTAVVLPSGIDIITPSAHTKLARSILDKDGLILSEYMPGTPAQAFRFVQRNRIIAALSPVTLVTQAPAGSGALITADYALAYGRDVMLHEECFSSESQLLEKVNLQELKAKAALRKKVSHKIEQSVQRYRDDGAPVIKSYAEYKQCRESAPGTVFCKRDDGQGKFF